jgi:hypothetical protein
MRLPQDIGESGAAGQDLSRRGLSHPAHVIIVLTSILAWGLDHTLAGWGKPTSVAIVGLFFPVFYWRDCWNRPSFWAAIALVSAAQIPFVIFARPILQRNPQSMLGLLFADPLLMTLLITLVSQLDSDSPLNTRNYISKRQ